MVAAVTAAATGEGYFGIQTDAGAQYARTGEVVVILVHGVYVLYKTRMQTSIDKKNMFVTYYRAYTHTHAHAPV